MFRSISGNTMFFTLNMLLVLAVWCAESAEVTIPDANLEYALRNALGISTGPITEEDLAGLNTLDASLQNISDLTGLEYGINLTKLLLDNNNISSIDALQGLTKLTELALQYNYISDISALGNLTNLVALGLQYNYISDIDALKDLSKLQQLDLTDNQISDVTELGNLTSLTRLNLNDNQIADISILGNLTYLVYLYAQGNLVSDISVLEDLIYLRELYLSGNQISDIGILENLVNLKELSFTSNQVNDISALTNLTNLMWLYLGGNQIADISPLENLTNLTKLHLWGNGIDDIDVLGGLPNLDDLQLYDNQIRDISALGNNMGLGAGDKLNLIGNPLNYEAFTFHIPALESRGVQLLFTARQGIIPPIEDLAASTGATGSIIELEWTTPENITPECDYVVRYNIVEITESNWDSSYDVSGEPIPGLAGTGESMAVTMPYANVVYYFAIKTQAQEILSDISNSPYARSSMQLQDGMTLYPGWNMVAFMGSTVMPIEIAMSSVSGKYTSVWRYDAVTSIWTRYILNAPKFLNNLQYLRPGWAYWIYSLEECTWDFGGGEELSPSKLLTQKPPYVLYGRIVDCIDGLNVSLKTGDSELAAYKTGSNPRYGDYYVLDVPVGDHLCEGDVARMYIDGVLMRNPVKLGGMGMLGRHDVQYSRVPESPRLFQNYPNPFNPETWIPYQLAEPADVMISIYDSTGRLVRMLNLGYKPAGHYITRDKTAYWDGRNAWGEEVSGGVYFYQLQAGDFTAINRMAIIK